MKLQFLFKSLPLAILALFTVATLSAQTGKSKAAPKQKVEASEAKEDEQMTKDLKLTPTQKAEFKKADDAFKAKAKAARNANKEEMEKMREERIRAHKAVLTPEQAKRYDETLAKREARRQEKHTQKSQQKAEKKSQKAEKKAVKSENKAIKKELDKQ